MRHFNDSLHSTPLRRDHEQCLPVGPAERARETAAIEIDHLQHLAALTNPDAPLVRNVRVPDSALAVEADAVRNAVPEIGP